MACIQEVRLRKNVPRTMPTSSMRWIDRRLPPNSHVNSSMLNPIITTSWPAQSTSGSARRNAVAPNTNTRAVAMSRYSASKPMIDGVRMRFCVMVWNTTVDTPTAIATTSIAATVSPRTCRANASDPGTSVKK
ncbi:hypothetical protein GCM10025877_17680 [Agromyces mangrovi Wang et al. 2018]|nr:hypothetical protein GCM10025877_17680 [Agromyces mangrovi]